MSDGGFCHYCQRRMCVCKENLIIYHVIEMPVDEHGRGPVRPEDADRTLWQVWDECNLTVCECTTKAHAERVARKLNAASPDPVAWLPIETAPKDGSFVMLYSPPMGRRIGCWDRVCWVTDCGYGIKPTHWMPLLEPPSDRGEMGAKGGER